MNSATPSDDPTRSIEPTPPATSNASGSTNAHSLSNGNLEKQSVLGSTYSTETLVEPNDPFDLGLARLLVVHTGLALCLFLATTDGTIVSTSLPTIVADLSGSEDLYAWVGTSYLLAQTASQPLWGQLGEILGLKAIVYSGVLIFLIGSAFCGAADSMLWLVIARALQGIGGGGIVTTVWTIMAKLVHKKDEQKWQGFMSVTWSLSAVAGPVLGGIFSDQVSWRWGFYVNLPVGTVALGLVVLSLRSVQVIDQTGDGKQTSRDWRQIARDFDYVGLGLVMAGTIALLLGFSFASTLGWNAISTILLLITGSLTLVCAVVFEAIWARNGVIPAVFFKDSTIGIIMAASFFQAFTFTACTFYLVLYYQAVTGASALEAGLLMLPYSLTSAALSWPLAHYSVKKFTPETMVITGFGLTTLGFGLMSILDADSSMVLREILPGIVGVGFSFLLKLPNTILAATLNDKKMASANGNFFLVRFIGATTGLSVASTVFNDLVQKYSPVEYALNPSSIDWRSLHRIQPEDLRVKVLSAVSRSISTLWIICAALMGISFLLCLLMTSTKPQTQTQPVSPQAREKDQSSPV